MSKGLTIRLRVNETDEALYRATANAMKLSLSEMSRRALSTLASGVSQAKGMTQAELVEYYGTPFGEAPRRH